MNDWRAFNHVKDRLTGRNKKTFLPTRATSAPVGTAYLYNMSVPLFRMVTLVLAVLVLGAATTASARPKKHRAERTATPITTCDGTPIIMQGIDCKKGSGFTGGEEQPTTRAQRPRVTARGSGGAYAPARLSTPSLPLSQPSAGVYIPPPVNNPSAQINQLNHSFPLNGGLGLNPTNRDAYIRYNLTR